MNWVTDPAHEMVKLYHVHGPNNTVYFVERTSRSGDKICLLRLNESNEVAKTDFIAPAETKIIAFEKLAFCAHDDPKKKDVAIELAFIDDQDSLHQLSVKQEAGTPYVATTSTEELICETDIK